MSQPSVQKIDGAWYWFDETWNRTPTAYATRAQALSAQNHYIDTVLEGRNWRPNLGDFVWWQEGPNTRCWIAQVVQEVLATNYDWYVELLEDGRSTMLARSHQLEPINEMEVIALAASRDDLTL